MALDGVAVFAGQASTHPQAVAASLDGVSVAIAQTRIASSNEQVIAFALDSITAAAAQGGQHPQALAVTLDDAGCVVVQYGAEPVPAGGGYGFEISAIRSVHRLSLVQRILAERASLKRAASYPSRKPAKKIEQQAAELALDDGSSAQFDAMLARWKAVTPPAAAMPNKDAEMLFMAHVAERIRQLQREQDDEEAVLALLMT